MGVLYRREYHRSILCSLFSSSCFLRIVWRWRYSELGN